MDIVFAYLVHVLKSLLNQFQWQVLGRIWQWVFDRLH